MYHYAMRTKYKTIYNAKFLFTLFVRRAVPIDADSFIRYGTVIENKMAAVDLTEAVTGRPSGKGHG